MGRVMKRRQYTMHGYTQTQIHTDEVVLFELSALGYLQGLILVFNARWSECSAVQQVAFYIEIDDKPRS